MELDIEVVKMFVLEDLQIKTASNEHTTSPTLIFNMVLGISGIDMKIYMETTAKHLFGQTRTVMYTTLMAKSGETHVQTFTGPAMEYLLSAAKSFTRQVANDALDVQFQLEVQT